jgi:orotate phosphoribosyltransferase
MEPYKSEFIEFMVRRGVLAFGEFTTKSGRTSPYFVDTGRYRTGADLDVLARAYARTALDRFDDSFDVLFGPAYKGIPLVVATSLVLHSVHGRDVGFCFDRKEAKDHGEGGRLVGRVPRDGERVLVLEDVTTAGTSIRHCVPLLRAAAPAVEIVGLVVAVDRQERGRGEEAALVELEREFGLRAVAIVTLDEIVRHLRGRTIDGRVVLDDELAGRIAAHRARWGAPEEGGGTPEHRPSGN